MRTVDLSHESLNLEELLQIAREQNLMLRLPDGKVFLLAEVEDEDEGFADEIEQTRQNQELMEFLDARSQEPGTYTLEQVRTKLGLAKPLNRSDRSSNP